MNELETANFALQQTTMQELVAWAPLISAGAAAVAAIGIWVGIVAMMISNMQRAKDAKEIRRSNDQRHEEILRSSDQRHEETLRANDQRHKEAMAAHEETMAAHKESMKALEELIRRTSNTGPAMPTEAVK